MTHALLPHQRLTADGVAYGVTRAQASRALLAIGTARRLMVAEANRLTRKRSMTTEDIAKHSELSQALMYLEPLVEAVGTEHNLSGY